MDRCLASFPRIPAVSGETTLEDAYKRITADVRAVLSVDNSVKSRVSHGGTAPKNVRREANRWLKALATKRR